MKVGWHRRLHLSRFLQVGERHLIRAALLNVQSVYDGEVESEGEWWGLQIADGEHLLYDRLAEALAPLDAEKLKAAAAAAPHAYAELLAVEHGFSRVSVVWPESLPWAILRDRALESELQPPHWKDGALWFRCLTVGRPSSLWLLCAGLDGALHRKQLLLTY